MHSWPLTPERMRLDLCSMRRVRGESTLRQQRRLSRRLPEKVEKVGVFVGQSVEDMHRIVEQAGLTAAQVHGESSQRVA